MSELQKFIGGQLRSERANRMRQFAARLPGAAAAREAYDSLEQVALTELKQRMDAASPPRPGAPAATAGSLSKRVHPRRLLTSLLDESAEQDKDSAQRSLYTAILLELTPDEACLLATLSDESEFALVNITVGNAVSGIKQVAGNFCSIERVAPIKLRDYCPAYIEHLLSLGLAEVGVENKTLEMKYQILEGHPKAMIISKELGKTHRSVRYQRRTLKISELGLDLWAFCDPASEPGH